jgi:serine phosphatase RsbU (regulator of sigma subunit)
LEKGDCIYLFTDGFADQFGGPRGKKMTKKRLLEQLLEIHHEPMLTQKKLLLDFFHSWKGELEQVDDVCFIGIRI